MAFSESRIGRVYVKEQGAWGTPQTSFAAADVVECEITYPELTREAVSTDTVRGAFHHATHVMGAKVGTSISLTMPLHGWSATTPVGNPTEHVDALLLKHALGGSNQAGYEVVDTSQDSTTVIKYNDGWALANWAGNAQLHTVSGGFTAGWVTSTDLTGDPDTATMLNQLSAQPTNEGQTYGSNTCYLTTGHPAAATPLTVQWEGSDANAGIRLSDGVVTSATITAGPRQQPTLSVTMTFLDWDNVTGIGSPGQYAHALPQMSTLSGENGARLVLGADLTVDAASFEVTIESEMAVIGSHSGNEGAAQYYPTNRTVTASIVIPQDGALTTSSPSIDPGAVQLDLAGTAGSSLSILIPEPRIIEQSTIGDSEGIVASTLSLGCAVMTSDASAGAGAAANSVFRVAFL